MTALPRSITVAGLGLMGGSLVHALARLAAPPHVTIVESDTTTLDAAAAAGLQHAAYRVLADAPASDLLVLATPVGAIIDTLRTGELDHHSFVTDVGSVKAATFRAAVTGGIADRYAGSHPLCGDHRGGFGAARADLYDGCTVYVTSEGSDDARALVTAVWQAVGGSVITLDAMSHDALVARTSHLPQVIASVLAATLDDVHVHPRDLGPGGRDTTRIAASDAALWVDILLHNRAALTEALARFDENVHELQRALDAGAHDEVIALLSRARAWRSRSS